MSQGEKVQKKEKKYGEKRGEKRGEEKGKKIGAEKERRELAKKMKEKGIKIEIIHEITKLTKEEIQKLKQLNSTLNLCNMLKNRSRHKFVKTHFLCNRNFLHFSQISC